MAKRYTERRESFDKHSFARHNLRIKNKKIKKDDQWLSQKEPSEARGAAVMGKQECGLQSVFLEDTLG